MDDERTPLLKASDSVLTNGLAVDAVLDSQNAVTTTQTDRESNLPSNEAPRAFKDYLIVVSSLSLRITSNDL